MPTPFAPDSLPSLATCAIKREGNKRAHELFLDDVANPFASSSTPSESMRIDLSRSISQRRTREQTTPATMSLIDDNVDIVTIDYRAMPARRLRHVRESENARVLWHRATCLASLHVR